MAILLLSMSFALICWLLLLLLVVLLRVELLQVSFSYSFIMIVDGLWRKDFMDYELWIIRIIIIDRKGKILCDYKNCD